MTFTALDFETAMPQRHSICQIGLVRVENGEIVHTYNELVQPPDNLYSPFNTRVHGIDALDTYSAPTFDEVWGHIQPFIEGQVVVAHNASFDVGCLKKALDYYQLPSVEFESACTYKIYKKKLNVLCDEYNIELKHHDALSDAKACGELYKRWLIG
jgi:DNA polymerase-3 subunit epsilon